MKFELLLLLALCFLLPDIKAYTATQCLQFKDEYDTCVFNYFKNPNSCPPPPSACQSNGGVPRTMTNRRNYISTNEASDDLIYVRNSRPRYAWKIDDDTFDHRCHQEEFLFKSCEFYNRFRNPKKQCTPPRAACRPNEQPTETDGGDAAGDDLMYMINSRPRYAWKIDDDTFDHRCHQEAFLFKSCQFFNRFQNSKKQCTPPRAACQPNEKPTETDGGDAAGDDLMYYYRGY